MMLRSIVTSIGVLLAFGAGQVVTGQTATATARIEGRVVTDDGITAVRRAIVSLTGGEVPKSRSAISDDNGAFAFTGLPAGSFSISASRPSFITSSYGAKSPGQPGTRISLGAGQVLRDAIIRVGRGAVVTGTVRNELGEPVVGTQVAVLSTRPLDSRTSASIAIGVTTDPTSYVTTDDRGTYRVFGLVPDTYFVAALMPQRGGGAPIELLSTAQMDELFRRAQQSAGRMPGAVGPTGTQVARAPAPIPPPAGPKYGYAPIYFPGTPDPGNASPLALTFGEERGGIDIALTLAPVVSIEGEVVSPDGPLTRIQLTLTPETQVSAMASLRQLPTLVRQPVTLPVPDGHFKYTGVTGGRYTITARTLGGQVTGGPEGIVSMRFDASDPAPPNLWAFTELTITDGDVSGVVLNLRPGLAMSGRLQFDRTTLTPPTDLTTLRVGLARTNPAVGGVTVINGAMFGAMPLPSATPKADGTFDLAPVYPGTYRLTAGLPAATGGEWWLRSAVAGGRDVLDEPLEIGADGNFPPVVITYSDRHTAINGSLQTPAGAPATDYFVIVFSADRRWWLPDSRRLAFVRPATDGRFSFRDLPPGEYHIAALTDLDTGTWRAPDFLDQVVPGALRLSLAEGETKTQDLRIAQ